RRGTMTKSDKKSGKRKGTEKIVAEKNEEAMVGGIMAGSPDAIGVAVIRLNCGCRKMAALDKDGEPASKVIMYRDAAASICDQCKKDNGAMARVTDFFIHFEGEPPAAADRQRIEAKVFGTSGNA
ncbi:MAG TPA: hypothetical protein VLA15_02450, partial [Desulfurivibrionaceae bacterium]|nr:hypothetical protein [Desulfurivibrionaceae bacterium]